MRFKEFVKNKRGLSLITALLIMLIITFSIAVVYMMATNSAIVQGQVQQYKSSKQAAESVAVTVAQAIDEGKLSSATECDPGCSSSSTPCKIDLQKLAPELYTALQNSHMSAEAYLVRNCTSSNGYTHIYTIEVEAQTQQGTRTHIYFIYKK
jgi:Tfp pilus assembly protein PilX